MEGTLIQVRTAGFEDKDIMRHLLEFLAYEHPSFDGADLDGHGRFGYRYLDHYWTDLDGHPYLITAGGRIAGMALVRDGPPHSMAEFLVMPRYRRAGVGRFAALRLFASLPGPWRVREVAGNDAAVALWRAVIPCPFADEQDEHGTTQLFTMPAGVSR